MDIARAILVALIALSVAFLPVAGASARALGSGETHVAAPSDCCLHGKDCDKPGVGDCGKSASCALKCAGLFAATLAPAAVTPTLSASDESVLLAESPTSRSSNPPLPPPRV